MPLPAPLTRPRRLLALLIFVLIPLLGFGDLAKDVYEREAFAWELPVMHTLRGWGSPPLTRFWYGVSVVGGGPWGWVLPLVLLGVAWRFSRRLAAFFLIGVGGAALLNVVLKWFFHRDRPTVLERLWQANDSSFPSGHAMLSAALAAAVVALLWRTRFRAPAVVLGGVYAALVGVSRVYLGVHYPTDVLAGWALGVAWVAFIAVLSWPLLPRAQRDARSADAP